MADDVIPDDIKQFILQHVDSIAQLEGLLMFHASALKELNAKAVAHGLYIDEAQAESLLVRLMEQGFLVTAKSDMTLNYRYQPKSPELRELVERLTDLYKRYLVPITNLIHSKSKNKIQEFANAFIIRKD